MKQNQEIKKKMLFFIALILFGFLEGYVFANLLPKPYSLIMAALTGVATGYYGSWWIFVKL
jgi:hypothetical protein